MSPGPWIQLAVNGASNRHAFENSARAASSFLIWPVTSASATSRSETSGSMSLAGRNSVERSSMLRVMLRSQFVRTSRFPLSAGRFR
ncbi:hypothetical protein DMC63_12665 [Streptomyces sp. WAC 05977]|nr:hypothetical protein DMC63_12665 [Streptomyces sp. WAC 05977]